MKIWKWIQSLWNKFVKEFKEFVAQAFDVAQQIVIGQLKDMATTIVAQVAMRNLTGAEKRDEAFKLIKETAINKGITIRSSLINVLLEMAYQRWQRMNEDK